MLKLSSAVLAVAGNSILVEGGNLPCDMATMLRCKQVLTCRTTFTV